MSTNNITIRSIEKTDRERWEQLFDGYADFYQVPLEANAKETVWKWIFDDENDFWCDLAINENNQIIGFTQYQLMHRSLSGEMVCYLSDLFVEPNIRGSGTGRKLIDHVIQFAKRRGISNVRWLTQDFNYPGRRLYDTYSKKSDFVLYSVPVK